MEIDWEAILYGAAVMCVEEIADHIVDHAKRMAPRDTGELQGSISRKSSLLSNDTASCEFGAYSKQATFIEWGTAGRSESIGNLSGEVHSFSEDWGMEDSLEYKYTFAPYIIRAKNAPYLVWEDHEGWHRVKKVTHPGIYPNPFMRPAIDVVRAMEVEEIVKKHFQRALKLTDGTFDISN